MRAHVKTEVAFLIETSREALVSMNVIVFPVSPVLSVKPIWMIASHILVSKVKRQCGEFQITFRRQRDRNISALDPQSGGLALATCCRTFPRSSQVQILGHASLHNWSLLLTLLALFRTAKFSCSKQSESESGVFRSCCGRNILVTVL